MIKFIRRLLGFEKHDVPVEKAVEANLSDEISSWEQKWESIDLFGEEKWGYIKNGIIKLYGIDESERFRLREYRMYGYPHPDILSTEIPLNNIPGNNNPEFFWHYKKKSLYADIYKTSTDSEGKKYLSFIWKHVNVMTPIKIMTHVVNKEREKKKEQEEMARQQRERFIRDSQDDTICDLLKVISDCDSKESLKPKKVSKKRN